MSLKTVRNVMLVLAIAIVVFLLLVIVTDVILFGYLTISLTFVYCLFLLVFWRCPKCHKFLGQLRKIQFCGKCGEKLEL